MERREFLAATASIPGCALTISAAEGTQATQAGRRYGVKITVLKRGFEKDLIESVGAGPKTPCTRFSDGQEFRVASQWAMPEKFCEWAYADIRAYIPMVIGQGNPIVVCCTDGYRPVYFKVERIEI